MLCFLDVYFFDWCQSLTPICTVTPQTIGPVSIECVLYIYMHLLFYLLFIYVHIIYWWSYSQVCKHMRTFSAKPFGGDLFQPLSGGPRCDRLWNGGESKQESTEIAGCRWGSTLNLCFVSTGSLWWLMIMMMNDGYNCFFVMTDGCLCSIMVNKGTMMVNDGNPVALHWVNASQEDDA